MSADQDRSQERTPGPTDTPMRERSADRRRVLELIAAGGGVLASSAFLPETWVKPVVDAVVVPAYAQASPVGLVCSTFLCTVTGWALGSDSQSTISTSFSASTSDFIPSLTMVLDSSGLFTAASCDGSESASSTVTVLQAMVDGHILFSGLVTSGSGTGPFTAAYTGIFVFTSTCAGV